MPPWSQTSAKGRTSVQRGYKESLVDTAFSTIRSCDLFEARETGTIAKKVD